MIESVYDNLGPFKEDDATGDLWDFMQAIGGPVDRIYGIVGEGDNDEPGWSAVFDLDRAETGVLPWTAQFVGSTITPAMTDADARSAIRTPDGFSVGLVEAIRAVAGRTLTGSKRVIIRQRNPGPEDLYVRTLDSETPDEDAVRRAILSQKPWHLVLNYEAVTGMTYIDLEADYTGQTYADLESDFAGMTYADLETTLP